MEPKLFRVIAEGNNNKDRTAKVYAATLRRIHKQVYKKELTDPTLAFVRKAKVFNHEENCELDGKEECSNRYANGGQGYESRQVANQIPHNNDGGR